MSFWFWFAAAASCLPLIGIPVSAQGAPTGGLEATPEAWAVTEWAHAAPKGPEHAVAFRPSQVHFGSEGIVITLSPANSGDLKYISGRLHTASTFQYGRVEVVASLPTGPTVWPAIWLRTPEGPPLNGELDMVEGFGSNPVMAQSTLHYWHNGVHRGFKCIIFKVAGPLDEQGHKGCRLVKLKGITTDLSGFHTYALDWTAKGVVWSLDGQAYFRTSQWVPRDPMALVLSLSAGSPFDRTKENSPAVQMIVRSVSISPYK